MDNPILTRLRATLSKCAKNLIRYPWEVKNSVRYLIHDQNNTVTINDGIPGDPWWIAKDVCEILEINNPWQAVSYLDDDEKKNIIINEVQSSGRGGDNGKRVIINEPGLYGPYR